MADSPNSAQFINAQVPMSIVIPRQYLAVASVVLYILEYVVNLPLEVALIWPRMHTAPSLLYLANRGCGALVILSGSIYLIPWTGTETGCASSQDFMLATQCIQYIVWSWFSTLRVFAVSGKNRFLSALVLILTMYSGASGLATLIFMLIVDAMQYDGSPEALCASNQEMLLTTGDGLYAGVNATMFASLIAADIIVITVTWWKTFTVKREALRSHVETPLVTLLLRDGTIYFLCSLALNIAQCIGIMRYDYDLTYVILSYSYVVISRFLLDLRNVVEYLGGDRGVATVSHVGHSQFTELHFASSWVGNMGEEVDGTFGFGAVQEPSDFEEAADDDDRGDDSARGSV